MIEIIPYQPDVQNAKLNAILARSNEFTPEIEATVREIVAAVRAQGDEALVAFTRKFDRVDLRPEGFRVTEAEIDAACRAVDPDLLDALQEAAANIRRFHEAQKRASWFIEDGDGVILGKRVLPIGRVAILIPGASAPLFSTLLMAAIPAQVAKVPQVCMATPPQADGSVHPVVLAAARITGVREIYRVFGAQAVAALAYGTPAIPKADKIVGPGNPYVQMAKKIVFGTVGIDTLAGPSEIVVLADESADPRHVAADLLSQAEHGSGFEASVCITPSPVLAQQVRQEVIRQTELLPRAGAIRKALDNFGAIVVVPGLDAGVDLVNRIAPEHVELLVAHPWEWLDRIQNAGAVFLGPASSEPVGDYFAGTNHILPTNGAARFASSLSVDDFLKTVSIVAYTERRLAKTAERIIKLAEGEGLDAHAAAIRVRLGG
ncbi:MAG: histidinol dehydrogenase [Candidatus Latescibacteria bacterium]|nr:histidinol dehydrogenase [Candidatus Latescibacterota bacterium]